MLCNSRRVGQLFRVSSLQQHVPDAPCVERRVHCRFKAAIRCVLVLQKSFHQFDRLPGTAEHGEILPRPCVGCAVARDLAVVFHSQKQIVLGACTHFRKKHACEIRRAVYLFECAFHHGTERIMHEPPQ